MRITTFIYALIDPMSGEARQNISRGRIGIRLTDEQRAAKRARYVGHPGPQVTPEQREKARRALIGRTLSPEHRAAISEGLRNRLTAATS